MFYVPGLSLCKFTYPSDNEGMITKNFVKFCKRLKSNVFFLCIFLSATALFGQDLTLAPNDFRIDQRADGGFHLFIRKKPGISSVLLTESTRDPLMREDNYAYRSPDWNPINGDEVRILDGVPIPRESKLWSLIDSTPEPHPELGSAFHVFIPWILVYGSENTRHGEVYVVDGTYFNVRSFALPYADYRGGYKDNPYTLKVTQEPLTSPAEKYPDSNYMKETVEAFTGIARNGLLEKATGPRDLIDRIKKILEAQKGKSVDIVICLDTTGSMRNDINAIREMLIPMLQNILNEYSSFRLGMVLFKDYYEEYVTRVIPFTKDFAIFQRNLNAIRVGGGRDIPEAVYEGLYDAATKFTWEAESRQIILIGDAPPHPRPRGKITEQMVQSAARERNIQVNAIILPQ